MIHRRSTFGIYLLVFILICDQLSKLWVVETLIRTRHTIRVTSFLNLILVWNKGITFGLMNNVTHDIMPGFLIGAAGLILFLLGRWLWRTSSTLIAVSLGAIMGGQSGTLLTGCVMARLSISSIFITAITIGTRSMSLTPRLLRAFACSCWRVWSGGGERVKLPLFSKTQFRHNRESIVHMMPLRSYVALGLAALMLSACGEVREDLGLGRNPPDEFSVVDRPPLSMPPDFDLRPPQPGAARPQTINMNQRASDVLFNGDTSATATDGSVSDSEKALLEQTGATKNDPGIRQIVDREAAQKVVSSPHLVDRLLWWKKDEAPATTVDAAAEAARIKDAKDKGQPLNQGATPVIERQKTGWLGL